LAEEAGPGKGVGAEFRPLLSRFGKLTVLNSDPTPFPLLARLGLNPDLTPFSFSARGWPESMPDPFRLGQNG
jgi:hypothetical protein